VLSQYLNLVHVIPSRLPLSHVLTPSDQHRSDESFFLALGPKVCREPKSFLKAFHGHIQQMLDAVFVGPLKSLYRAKKREDFFNGKQSGLVIGVQHSGDYLFSPR